MTKTDEIIERIIVRVGKKAYLDSGELALLRSELDLLVLTADKEGFTEAIGIANKILSPEKKLPPEEEQRSDVLGGHDPLFD